MEGAIRRRLLAVSDRLRRMISPGETAPARLAFHFPTGAHYDRAIGRRLYQHPELPFRETIDTCDQIVGDRLGLSLVDRYFRDDDASAERHNAFSPGEPAMMAAVQIALVRCWRERGFEPDAVVGECGGEIAAAYATNALSLEAAMEAACATALHIVEAGFSLPDYPHQYLMVEADAGAVQALLDGSASAAHVVNLVTPTLTVVTGSTSSIARLAGILDDREIRYRHNKVDSPSVHCSLSDQSVPPFLAALEQFESGVADRPAYTYSDFRPLDGQPFDSFHFTRVFLGRLFHDGTLARVVSDGYQNLLVMGVSTISQQWVHQSLPPGSPPPLLAIDPDEIGRDPLAAPIRALHERGIVPARQAASSGRPSAPVRSTGSSQPAFQAHTDLFSPEVLADPYPYYRHLREHTPVAYSASLGGWLVARYADVLTVLKTPDVYSSSLRSVFDPVLLGTDPPEHTRVRSLFAERFHRKEIARLEDRVRVLADGCIDRLLDGARGELMADVAAPLPVRVIAEMLGLDASVHGVDLKRWADAAVLDAGAVQTPEQEQERFRLLGEFDAFLRAHLERAGATRSNELLSIISHAAPHGSPLTLDEQVSLARLLVVGGHETTTYFIANAVLALLRHRQVYRDLRREPALIPAFIEEVLRFDSPVLSAPRQTSTPVVLSGTEIPAGSNVFALLASANRDERVFEDAEAFRLDRTRPHLSFGSGPHVCVGLHLARLEARVVLERLLDRTHHFWSDVPLASVRQTATLTLRRIERLPLRLVAR